MSRKFNEEKCCIEIAKHWLREFDFYEEEYNSDNKVVLNSVEYSSDNPYYFHIKVNSIDPKWAIKLEVFFNEYSFKKKKYLFNVYCYAIYEPLANKVKFSCANDLFKLKTPYTCDLDENNLPTNINYNPDWTTHMPGYLGDIIRFIQNKPLVSIYLSYREEGDRYASNYTKFLNEREMKKEAKRVLRDHTVRRANEEKYERKLAEHAKKLFEEECNNNTKIDYWRSEYYPENLNFDWSGIENLHIELIDNGKNCSLRYDICIVSDVLVKQIMEEENLPYEKVCRRTTQRLCEESWKELKKIEKRYTKKKGAELIGGYGWASIIDEAKYRHILEFNVDWNNHNWNDSVLEWKHLEEK